jgi:phospholipid transport system substrate-binding protein
MTRVTAALAIVLLLWTGARAETSPTDFLQRVFDRANDILTDPQSADRPLDRLLAVRKLVNEAFDFRGAAKLASGERWRARTAAEQEEFTWLFSDLLERGFVAHVAAKANLTGGTRIRYLDESIEGGTATVQTAVARRNGSELMLDYDLVERDGTWKIRDVTLDGVSLMANYRAQLDRVLGTASFAELLSQMRAKVGAAEALAETAAPAAAPGASESARETIAAVDVPAPLIPMLVVADMSLPAPPIRLSTFEPRIAVPEGFKPVPRPDEPAAPPAANPAPVATSPTKSYWLRVMTGGTADQAGRLVSRLRSDKLPIVIDRTNGHGKLTVSVRVGPFRDAKQAVRKLHDLRRKGHHPSLVAERD